MKRSRVLHICSGNLYGGVETLLVTLAQFRNLCPEMEPEFTVCFEGRLSQELSAAGVDVHNIGAVRVRNPFSIWKARAQLQEVLSRSRFDVAICHSAWTHGIFGPVVREKGMGLISWLHGVPTGKHWLEKWAQRIEPDFIICNSRFTAGHLSRVPWNAPYEVVYCPVPSSDQCPDATVRSQLRRELGTTEGAVVIVQASRMEAWKGHRLHLEALAQIRDVPGWVCWIAGGAQQPKEESYFVELQEISQRLLIADRVRFLGQRADVRQLLTAADVFCQPNLEPEPFGLVFIEALLASLPVVTTALGGALEIVQSDWGALVPPGDVPSLAAALEKLIGDSALRARMGSAGPAHARKLCAPGEQLMRLENIVGRLAELRRAA
jgi:glycosyltransferase involved in cell wall biosynthesis